jgi:metal-responsive CopG/Arc/MetJ family transcriptional regulator
MTENQTEYQTIKIPEETIKNLKKALRKKGINPRSNAEAVNTLINNFLLKSEIKKDN